MDGFNVGSSDGMLEGLIDGIIDRLGLCESAIVGNADGLFDGLIDKEGISVGRFCSEGLDDGLMDKVGLKVSDMVKVVVSVRSKLETDLITVLSRPNV